VGRLLAERRRVRQGNERDPQGRVLGLLAHGGARFARSLVATGLIDEYRLVIHPAVLGAGARIFPAPLAIEPVSTTVFRGGAVAHVFTAHP
jgi:riboflavin biosynthesis pyrimidine reductase